MKKILLTLALGLTIVTANAQIQILSGPRLGFTLLTAGKAADYFNKGYDYIDNDDNKLGESGSAFTTQFGWQWESRFADGGGDIVGIVELIALVGGMEQGLILPSISSVIGARTAKGLEFSVGPNLSLSGIGMLFAIGHNFKSGSLNIPVNLVIMPGRNVTATYLEANGSLKPYEYNTGARISLMVGFNLGK